MSDIRNILNALNDNDKRLWQMCRTDMHRCYLSVLHNAMHIDQIESADLAFLDLLDNKLALIFERAGRFQREVESNPDSEKIEAAIMVEMKKLDKLHADVVKQESEESKAPAQALALVDKATGSNW